MSLSVAYLSQGKLYFKPDNQAVREIESEFGRSVQERRLQNERRQALRDRSIRAMLQPPTGDRQNTHTEAAVPVHITSICRIEQDQLLYTLESTELGGLFQYNPTQQSERRLFHSTEFQIGFLDFSKKHQLMACTKNYPTGISNLATLELNDHRPLDLTEGDSIDCAPHWSDRARKAIVYQSAGVSRNSQGYVVNRAPFAIMELDFEQQDVRTLAEDPKSDLLGPQCSADGWLYYIRRPYKPLGGFSLTQLLKDLLLLPVRLLYAIFQFFNIFSQMTTGQPLINATTRQEVGRQPLRTLGGTFFPENLPKKHRGETDAPALVPPSWQLVRQGVEGVPEILAKSVLSYDLAEDGTIVYTNGSGVFAIRADGNGSLMTQKNHERILVGRAIEGVTVLTSNTENRSS
ncbi:hypothetical protein KR51_00003870 [Rubidibacter lacunae KORDI 51-2]|uniref:Uncharacterized protein n=1 Tax=Rubidibacter lacunae KORDI 51-2 TaxID=582515 RepID=U5DMG0_9CHRO|nr:hypothetical protein [Rubidibacter lacunae]ERN42861.1 hypothetical protein KR51_00003870 [Rubidibacter lacunae KORDI 51-2]